MRPGRYLARTALVAVALWSSACLEEGFGTPFDGGLARDGGGPADGAAADAGDTPPEDLDGYVQWEMARHGVAGLAAVILKDDAPAWTGTFGMANLEEGIPVAEETLFLVASISKTVVTVPLVQLVERGLVDLDAPIDTYLSFPVRHPDFPDTPVTTRMLLTHTSGIEDDFPTLARVMSPGPPSLSLGEFSEQYLTPGGSLYTEASWGAEPGTGWSYSNAAFGLVGHLVEVVGGSPLPEQTRTGVLEPLAMADSSWSYTEAPAERLAVGYTWNARTGFSPVEYEGMANYPAGSFVTSLRELTRFLRAFVRFGELDGARILAEGSATAMRERQVPDLSDRQALTWRYSRLGDRVYLGHSGATLGGSANMMFRPDDGVAILMLTNSDAYVLDRLGLSEGADALRRILERLAEEADRL